MLMMIDDDDDVRADVSGNEHEDQIGRQLRMRDCHLLVLHSTGGPRDLGVVVTLLTFGTLRLSALHLHTGTQRFFDRGTPRLGSSCHTSYIQYAQYPVHIISIVNSDCSTGGILPLEGSCHN